MGRVTRPPSGHFIARRKYLHERAAARRTLTPQPSRPKITLNLNRNNKAAKKKLPPTPIETRRMKKQKMLKEEQQQQQHTAQAAQQKQAPGAESSVLSDADTEMMVRGDSIAMKQTGPATTTGAAADNMDPDDVSTDEEDNKTHDMNEVDDLEPRDTTALPPANAPNSPPHGGLGTKGKLPARDPVVAPQNAAKPVCCSFLFYSHTSPWLTTTHRPKRRP